MKADNYRINMIPPNTVITLMWQKNNGLLEPIPTLMERLRIYFTGEWRKK
jgi:hypothetical protein